MIEADVVQKAGAHVGVVAQAEVGTIGGECSAVSQHRVAGQRGDERFRTI